MEFHKYNSGIFVVILIWITDLADCRPSLLSSNKESWSHKNRKLSLLFNSIEPQRNDGKLNVSTRRKVRLLSAKTGKYLQIKRRNVDALGSDSTLYANLWVESVGYSLVRLKGDKSRRYICFNHRSHLVGKRHGDDDGCIFRERIDPQTLRTYFTSYKMEKWSINIRNNGQMRPGSKLKKSSKSFRESREFIERWWT